MLSSQLREKLIGPAKSAVIKIGTAVLTRPDGTLDRGLIRKFAAQMAQLRQQGRQITVVSSGAIGAGMGVLRTTKRPTTIPRKQATAAVGQQVLMRFYEDAFKRHGLQTAQMLLTRAGFENRTRYLNIRNTISTLHRMNVVPIVNENDTVAIEEIEFGDNDLLSALTTNLLRADLLIMLTVVDGLLDRQSRVIDLVEAVDQRTIDLAGRQRSALGSGGMISKLDAVRAVTEAGELAVIANGRTRNVLTRLFQGEKLGTVFVPAAKKLSSRRRWIGWTVRPAGQIHVDAGAARALLEQGKSLLAIGVTKVTGQFHPGDVVEIRDPQSTPFARGLVSFSAADLTRIQGRKTPQFQKILGYTPPYEEVIHRNQLVLLKNRPR
jgi:glutamate 5-kinase